jgi:uncharacterized membrane protein YgcG
LRHLLDWQRVDRDVSGIGGEAMSSGWTLSNVALATTAIFLFHGFVLAPVAARALRRADVHRVGYWSAVTAAVDASKLVWMMLALSSLITWGAISLAGTLGGETAAAAQSAINRLRYIRAAIVSLEQGGSLLLLGLASAALLFWIWRYNARRVAGVIEQVRMAQAEDLFEKLKQGTLPELEPDDAMQRIGGIIGALKARQQQVEKTYAEAANDTEKTRLAAERARLASDEQTALRAYVANDIERRIDVSPLEALEGDIPRPARTFSERLGRFLISRGLLQRLNWGQRGLLLLNLLMAIPTVLVAAQADVAQRLDAREFRLAELRVDFTARERAAELSTAIEAAKNNKQADNTPQPNQVQITQTANHVGQVFERSLGETFGRLVRSSRSGDQLTPAELIKARADMRAAKARREVLLISAADRPDGGIYVDTDPIKPGELALPTGSVSRAAEPERTIPGLLDSSMNAASDLAREDGKPLTAIGRAMARQVQELMMTSATARDAVMSASASFQEVARPSQVANILLAEIFSGTSHVATADFMTPEMSAWLNQTVSAPVGDRVTAALSNSFRATLIETRDLAKATAVLGEVASNALATADFSALKPTIEASLPNDAENAEIMRSRHPGLRQSQDAKVAATQHDLTKAVYTAQLDPRDLGREQEKQLEAAISRAGATQSFEDIVPPTTSAPPPGAGPGPQPGGGGGGTGGGGGGGGTGGGGGIGGGGGGGGGRPHGEARAAVRPSSMASVARGRSFTALRGFARVGGVLIGREPEAGTPPLDFPVFEWTRDGSGLRFHLGAADGSTVDAGPFHASVVHGALAYAADGRALTATMISAEPLRDLKILLHPALLDTSLGCRAISIDRFADETTGQDKYPERSRAERGFQANVLLYEIARAAIIDSVVDQLTADDADDLKQSAASAHALIAQIQAPGGGDDADTLSTLIGAAASVDPAGRSASGLHRFDHFSRDVVGLVEACQGPNVKATDFVTCTRDRSKKDFGPKDFPSIRDKLVSAVMPVPTYQIWSGVREAPFSPDPRLSFFTKRGPDTIQFMVQVAFTSKPYQKILRNGGKSDEAGDQTDPYEFGNLKISDRVLEMVAANPEKRDVFDGIVEFTALQRLFRLAFDGRLGGAFPVEKLAELESATRVDVKQQSTPRWNPHGGEFSFLLQVASALPRMPAELKSRAEACLKANGMPAQAPAGDAALQPLYDAWRHRAPLSSSDWAAACVFPDNAAPSSPQASNASMIDLTKFSQGFPATRDLRHSLGVDAAERSDAQACGPL